MLNTPILLIIFNRPDTTKQVLARIREAQPRELFVAADGPRTGKTGEKEKCEEVRQLVLNGVDWDCKLHTLFRDENRGCGHGPAEAITWFFENVEQGIILEDDCVPDLSFFTFCQELLDRYKNNERVMHIGGTNSQFGKKRSRDSYYFSKYPHIWGWATWRRAWNKFKYVFTKADELQLSSVFNSYDFDSHEKKYWLDHWNLIKNGKQNDIWDVPWTFSCWLNNGVTIVPDRNLISNIGFNSDATHTINSQSKLAGLTTQPICKISHPKSIKINDKADKFTFRNYNLLKPSAYTSIRSWVSKVLPEKLKDKIKKI